MRLIGFLSLALFWSISAKATYPGIGSSGICNSYDTVEGIVTNVVATTTYDSYEAVYVGVVTKGGNYKYGGRIYPRDPVAYGYVPMVNIANIALVTKTPVKLCVNSTDKTAKGNDIYAIELLGDR